MSHPSVVESMTDDDLAVLYAWPTEQCVRLNMVLDAAGLSTGHDNTSHSLASAADRRVLREIRREAEVIIVGAKSVRREGWFLPPTGSLFVLSGSGDLPWKDCPDRTRVHVFSEPSALIHAALKAGRRILCEGGLSTANIIDERLGFDQVALTVHGDSEEALGLITGLPLNFAEQHSLASSENSEERFVLWRRAIPSAAEPQF